MPKRMPEEARGFARPPRAILAYTRTGIIWFRSLAECRDEFGIRTTEQLARMIDSGQVAPDGYTTFDDPIDGVVYFGMTDEDIKRVKERK